MLTRLLLLVPSLAVVAAADPVTGWLGFPCSHTPVPDSQRRACIVTPDPNGGDDAPTLVQALSDCREQGHVILPGPKYHIDSVMNTTGLRDVKIDIYGVLQWSTNTSYWLSVSMPVGYQNQSTVWFLGGDLVQLNGFGNGTLDGNGQAWYDLVRGISNYPRRPMAVTFWALTNSVVSGLRFLNSQMWTMAIMHSRNVLMEDIYVNNTSTDGNPARNTDGADTIYADHITFSRWTIDNGDDAIATKANSTNIVIKDSVFHRGQGIAVGSIGQYPGVYEIIENFYVHNVTLSGTAYAGYVKTWTGVELSIPPNGGGGGLGHAKNIIWEDLVLDNVRSDPFSITQCNSFSGYSGIDCNTSMFKIEDLVWTNISGTAAGPYVGSFSCSAAAGGCSSVTIEDVSVLKSNTSTYLTAYECVNVTGTFGFTC